MVLDLVTTSHTDMHFSESGGGGGGGGRYMVHPGVQSISRLIIMFFLRD